jgi:hypothetical protein
VVGLSSAGDNLPDFKSVTSLVDLINTAGGDQDLGSSRSVLKDLYWDFINSLNYLHHVPQVHVEDLTLCHIHLCRLLTFLKKNPEFIDEAVLKLQQLRFDELIRIAENFGRGL